MEPNVITFICKRGGGGVFLRSWPLGEGIKENGQKTHKSAYILSRRCDVTFWHDVIRRTQIWAVKIGAPQIDGRRSYRGFNMRTG
jgi:hypothetical protein